MEHENIGEIAQNNLERAVEQLSSIRCAVKAGCGVFSEDILKFKKCSRRWPLKIHNAAKH